jgi:hypothetical protein
MWRVLGFLLLAITIDAVPASAAEWDCATATARLGGRWDVREQPGLWVAYADFVHVDSRCGRGTNAAVRTMSASPLLARTSSCTAPPARRCALRTAGSGRKA